MGIVYYSRYFEYFEEARTELLSSIGLGVTDVEKKGIMLPVISSHCDYLKGARFEQNIIIRASISTEPRSKLQIDYSVFIENEKEPTATGYTDHAFVNDRGVAVRAPKMILERLNQKV
jgi:acyl-CoA thioester hydrolase